MNETAELVIASIFEGDVDDDLDQIVAAVKERRSHLAQRRKMLLSKGDRVRFTELTRPKYMIGELGTITERPRPGARLKVKLDRPLGRFGEPSVFLADGGDTGDATGPVLRVAASIIEKI